MLQPLVLTLFFVARLDSPLTDRAEALAAEALQQSHEARAAAPLIALRELLPELDDLNLLAEPYSVLIERRQTHPQVRLLAKLFMAEVERARGRMVKSKEILSELGFVQDFYVVGAFDNEGKNGCDLDFGPESAVDLKATYPARSREVAWHKLYGKSVDGFVDLSLSLKPNSDAVGYALTWLQSDVDTQATLSLGVSGGVRLFVNGQKVLTSNQYNLPRVDQHRVQINLRKGLNRVLLKVCQTQGPLGFFFRAERSASHRPLTAVLPDAVPPLSKGSAPQPQLQPTLSEVLEKQVKAAPRDASLRAAYATVLAFTRAYPDSEHTPEVEAERAALQAPEQASLQWLAAQLHFDDGNDRRRFLEAALAIAPTDPFVRLELGQHELAKEHPERALQLADALVERHPNFAPAWLLKVRAHEALGQKVKAWKVTEDAFARLHLLPSIAREAIVASRRVEHPQEAVERARKVLALRYDDVNTRRGLAALFADLGKIHEAGEQYQKVLALDPFDLATTLRLGELWSANGRPDDAERMFAQAKLLAPDDSEVYEREGRALLRAGKRAQAEVALQHALALRPQNAALKEMLRILKGDDAASAPPEFFALPPLVTEAVNASSSDDAIILAEATQIRVQASGLAARVQQLVVKVFSERGVEAWRSFPITWSPDRQEVRVVRARVTKPDGSVIDAFGEEERQLNEPGTQMYYDARARLLSFPSLSPGDVLEVQWRLDDTAQDNLLSDYWGDVEAVQGVFAKRHFRYVVDMPQGRPLSWNQRSLPKWLTASSQSEGDRVIYRFEAKDVPKFVPEPQMPGWAEIAPPLHVSTYQTWEQVGRYYWGLVREQLVPNEALKQAVEVALKGVDRKDVSKVVAALYGYVVTNTRYVALEFGIHGYKPYRVDRILARKFGDCKDKASLIYAMLKVAGVDSRLVLLRMRHLGTLSPEVASLAAFNHAIVYVPQLNLYLDGTAEFHGSHELPAADRLANVLIVEPDGGSQFLTIPEAQPTDNTSRLNLEVALKPDGSAVGKARLTTRGQGAAELRRQYETPATRVALLEQEWAQSFPGAQIKDVKMGAQPGLEQPIEMEFALGIPRFAEAGGGLLRFFPFGAGRTLAQALAPLPERQTDVLLSGVWVNELEIQYTLPAQWELGQVSPEVTEESEFGSFHLSIQRVERHKFKVSGRLELSQSRISRERYPAFRAWLLKVDQIFNRKLVAQQGGQTALAR